MLKKHRMMFEFIAMNESEMGGIDISTSVGLMSDIRKIAQKYKFDPYIKGYPKDVIDYIPSGKTY